MGDDGTACPAVTHYGVCIGTDEDPAAVMDVVGSTFRYRPHPTYEAVFIQVVRPDKKTYEYGVSVINRLMTVVSVSCHVLVPIFSTALKSG